MDGQTMRKIRGTRTGEEFSKAINEALGKRTDRHKVSKWENSIDEIPAEVNGLLRLWSLEYQSTGECQIISVSCQKGGTLKTTSSVGLAYVLAMAGARVLLVDADSQANSTAHVGFDEDVIDDLASKKLTLYHALAGQVTIDDILLETTVPNLHLAPSSIHLALCEVEFNDGSSTSKLRLKKVLQTIRSKYDFIIIDTSPSLGLLTVNSLVAADKVLIPVQVERFAVTGLRHLINTLDTLPDHLNKKLEILGILPTLFTPRQVQDRDTLDEVQRWADNMTVFSPIPRSSYFAKAAASLCIPYAVNPGAAGLESFIQIAQKLGVVANG